ncbi:uncharacterized protein BO87DRAFT_416260 [Aspergillus neoniger CBS 115656]|uniref:Uncharacterized protein n=1 Tax=Aspergillus neoniger (strain CBS 115656) TaxID=1448310 RepID=A0A318YMZ4_ASPNB|nr:hypothetical protein BO87DRAFT_416260 [Aspergillus neoniger CBS 115656]PYH34103.1 hypothetical protein BO87DRAFT_416260 [Aspergillus neoniger CBS 115656]
MIYSFLVCVCLLCVWETLFQANAIVSVIGEGLLLLHLLSLYIRDVKLYVTLMKIEMIIIMGYYCGISWEGKSDQQEKPVSTWRGSISWYKEFPTNSYPIAHGLLLSDR